MNAKHTLKIECCVFTFCIQTVFTSFFCSLNVFLVAKIGKDEMRGVWLTRPEFYTVCFTFLFERGKRKDNKESNLKVPIGADCEIGTGSVAQ